jgi:uncharacterized membrane protein
VNAAWIIPATIPLLLWLGEGRIQRWALPGVFLILALLRPPLSNFPYAGRWWTGSILVLAAFTAWTGSPLPMKLYPASMNAAMLAAFGFTLIQPPSMAERFARLREPHLPPEGIIYTRRVTIVWCCFFLLNGSIALITAFWAPAKIWALYNGLIAYILIGLLFAGEYLVRLRFKARLHA